MSLATTAAMGDAPGAGGHTPLAPKRTADVLSPTGISPPSKAGRNDFVEGLIAALQDVNTKAILKELLSDALADKLADMTIKVDELRTENLKLKGQINGLVTRCNELEEKQDDLEQYGRRYSLRLHTDIQEEDREDTDQIVLDAVRETGVDIKLDDISRSHRVGRFGRSTNSKPRAIIFRLISYRMRRDIFSHRKRLLRKQFIAEDLTAKRAHLLFLCRNLKRAGVLQYVWSSDGRILVKQPGDNAHTVHITSEGDLTRFGPAPAQRMSSVTELDESVRE